MCDKMVSDGPCKLKYCHDSYKAQEMCDKAVDDFLPALKFVPNWVVTSKLIRKLFTALYSDNNILHFNEDSGDAVFACNNMGINHDDINYGENDPETVTHIRLLAWHIKFEKRTALKKS